MMIKKTLFLPLMATAIGGPMVFMSGDGKSKTGTDELDPATAEINLAEFQASKIYQPVPDLAEIFDLNQTPQMIEARWKKITKSSVGQYQIYRTSILSGHQSTDLVGALTYQVNFNGRIQEIRFSGYVDDPNLLIGFVNYRYGFRKTNGPGLEFRATPVSGYGGNLMLTPTGQVGSQFKVDFLLKQAL